MFRQIVVHTWADSASEDDRAGFRGALDALRAIPELVSLRFGEDAGRFAGNFDFAAVMDFADFDSARRYVEHPLHRSFIADHAKRRVAQRVVVQHEWAADTVVGFHHVKLPVTGVARSQAWYEQVFGFRTEAEFVEDGLVCGVALRHPVAGIALALREDATRARALRGFDAVCLAVSTRAALDNVAARLDAAAIPRTPVVRGRVGWCFDVPDPDGIVLRLYTHEIAG